MKSTEIFYIPEIFVDIIKNQALSSENEIYGWLIGYQTDNIPNVLAIIECKRFEQQTLISAIPHAQEFQEISSIMPQGIGAIGIYHSHPFSSEIFHSHTDDSTLLSLSKQFPNCVSIVTNGKEINYYQMGKNNQVNEINVKHVEPEIPKFLLFALNASFLININKDILNATKNVGNLRIRILNEISNYLELVWSDSELFVKNSKVFKTESITRYLVNKLTAVPMQLKIPAKTESNNTIQIFIDSNNNEFNNKTEFINNHYESFILDIDVKAPIYITAENKNFGALNQIIKTELVSNNILQKIFNCVINLDNRKIIIPDDYHVNFFGFYIRLTHFNKKKLNDKEFSRKTFEFLSKIVSQFDSFTNTELSDKIKSQIRTIFKDIKKISKKFSWYNEIRNNVNELEKYLISDKK